MLACSRYLLQLYPCASVKASVGCIALTNQFSDDSTFLLLGGGSILHGSLSPGGAPQSNSLAVLGLLWNGPAKLPDLRARHPSGTTADLSKSFLHCMHVFSACQMLSPEDMDKYMFNVALSARVRAAIDWNCTHACASVLER